MAGSGSSHSKSGSSQRLEDDDSIALLRQEYAELKHSYVRLQGDYDELVQEQNFYRVKVSELSEIVHVKGDEAMKQLATRAMQNAELSIELGRLSRELQMTSATIQKLEIQREQNKRMLLEINQIKHSLKPVKIDGRAETISDDDSCSSSLMNVKAKVDALMDDRRLLVNHCQTLETENKHKDDKIVALEALFHLFNSMNIAENDLAGGTATQVGFPPSATFSSSSSERPAVETHMRGMQSMNEYIDDDISTEKSHLPIIGGSTTSISVSNKSSIFKTKSKIDSKDALSPYTAKDDDQSSLTELSTRPGSLSSMSSEHELQSLNEQLVEAKHQHQQFKQVCQMAFSKMKFAEHEVAKLQRECLDAKSKREALKLHLLDVIDQYKTLNGEHQQVLQELEETKSRMHHIEKMYVELRDEKMKHEEYGANILEEEGLADDTEKLVKAYLITLSRRNYLRPNVRWKKRRNDELVEATHIAMPWSNVVNLNTKSR